MNDLTPSQKGAVAEAAITAAAIQLGLVVLRPLCEGGRYDLMFDLDPTLLRVQCKLARHVGGVLSVNLQTSRHTPNGYVRTSYTASEIDAVAAYSPHLNECFLMSVNQIADRRVIYLRLEPARNNQNDRINWARDYEFPTVMKRMKRSQLETRQP
jgi:hypothetical protein